jgi:hypothetical protein
MTDQAWRLSVLSLVLVVVAVVWWWGRSDRPRLSFTTRPDLAPGVYLFSSSTCLACGRAREALAAVVGAELEEIRFEDDPGGFGRYAIARVPTAMFVGGAGQASVVEGIPSRRQLRRLQRSLTCGDP